jgi:hypothetical protein
MDISVLFLAVGAGKNSALRESLRADGWAPLARVIWSRSETKIFLCQAGFKLVTKRLIRYR